MPQDPIGLSDQVALQYLRQSTSHESEADKVPSVIAMPESIDAWRHLRMYEPLAPLITDTGSWLTIGDSGGDAHWLRSRGVSHILASSIVDRQLCRLRELGHLPDISIAALNAEDIALEDESYDFVLCKEAFHHFARPMIGLYEMLRVARLGVVLLAEPNGNGRERPLDIVKTWIKRFLRRGTELANDRFESSGNFIYGPSMHEVWKAAAALQYRHLYFLYLNDFFHAVTAACPMSDRRARRITQFAIGVQNLAARIGLMSWGSVTILLLKQEPTKEQAEGLAQAGFRLCEVPRNPYI